jgi:VWA domain containing CoxE-like protein
VRSNGAYGLILFSDVAYQALPPHTPAKEIKPLQRFFKIPEQGSPGALPRAPRSPWTEAFSAGTRISDGLALALNVIRDNRLVRPAVLLVSDLDDDDGDIERVSQVAIALRRAGIPLHVVGLNAEPEDAAFIRRFTTGHGSFTEAALPSKRGSVPSVGVDLLLVGLGAAVALALGAYLLLSEPLRWRAS